MSERTKSTINFINLHAHTCLGSIFDAIDMPCKHFDAAYQNGMSAMSVTEHGNANSVAYALHHQNKMLKDGKQFKYIIGCESYFLSSIKDWHKEYESWKAEKERLKKKVDEEYDGTESDYLKGILKGRSHLVLLAQNQEGLNNLYQLISLSNQRENFYRHPRIDFSMLKQYNKGLIASTACLSGYLSMEFLKCKKNDIDPFEHLSSVVQKFLDIFGDRFYGELQWNLIKEQHEINQIIISLSQKFGFELISTCDSHYPTKDSWKDRELYKRLGWMGKVVEKPHWQDEGLPNSIEDLKFELYPKNGDEVWESYKNYSKKCGFQYDDEVIAKSLENTCKIAYERVEDYTPDKTIRLPNFVKEKNETPEYTLSKLAIKGLKKLGLDKKKEYVDRLKREIKIIQKKNFSQYFLTMKQIVDFGSKTQMYGPGRGSAAGSLISYCLGITQVDPLRWNLQFERFISEESVSYPDIDTDWEQSMELKEDLKKEWGENSVIPVSNFMTLQMRSLVKDVSKFYDISYQEVNDVTSKMLFEATPPAKKDHDILSGVYTPTFEELKKYSKMFSNFLNKYPKVAEHLEALEGQIRQCFTENMYILTNNGYKTIKEITNNDKIAFLSNEMSVNFNGDYEIYYNGKKDVYKIELEGGECLELSKEHQVFTKSGYKKVCELKDEDEILCMN